MREYGFLFSFTRVIANEYHGIEAAIDPLHHAQRTWPGTHDPHTMIQKFGIDILPVPMRVADDNIGRACIVSTGNCRVDLKRH